MLHRDGLQLDEVIVFQNQDIVSLRKILESVLEVDLGLGIQLFVKGCTLQITQGDLYIGILWIFQIESENVIFEGFDLEFDPSFSHSYVGKAKEQCCNNECASEVHGKSCFGEGNHFSGLLLMPKVREGGWEIFAYFTHFTAYINRAIFADRIMEENTPNRIKALRQQKGYTQKELAEKAGISVRTLQRIEADSQNLKGFSLRALAEVFELEPEELVGESMVESAESDEEDSGSRLALLNLACLSFLLIPFGNLIVPLIMWSRMKKNDPDNELARRIINVQILWTVVTSLLLIATPLVQGMLKVRFPGIFIVLIGMISLNFLVILFTASAITRKRRNFLNLKIRVF